MADKFRLTQSEANTDTWRRLKAHYEARLKTHRENLEKVSTTPELRAQLVLRIDEIKNFLAAGETE
jgi:hypothetical protein